MPAPISAVTSWALILPVPCTASSCPVWCSQGPAGTSILVLSSSMCVV
jgi:hypothetical protein